MIKPVSGMIKSSFDGKLDLAPKLSMLLMSATLTTRPKTNKVNNFWFRCRLFYQAISYGLVIVMIVYPSVPKTIPTAHNAHCLQILYETTNAHIPRRSYRSPKSFIILPMFTIIILCVYIHYIWTYIYVHG